MSQSLKIAIIGDYNFTFNSHQATNLALDHSSRFLEIDLSYYWIKTNESSILRTNYFSQFDGVWVAPGPYQNGFFLSGILKQLITLQIPVLLTGECFKSFIDMLINSYQLNPHSEKLISDNLVEGSHFDQIQVIPHSNAFIQLYQNHSNVELTSSRFSLYPQLISALTDFLIDIEGFNQFEEPEIISLKNHDFFVACGFCPQISSTRELPHPLVYTFIKAIIGNNAQFKSA
jgi:CTP synthase (UTP-ammonia lyase)